MESSNFLIRLYWSGIVLTLPWQPASNLALTTPDNCTLLTIEAEPEVAQVGSTVRLNCSLSLLYNASDIQWFHNGSSLTPMVPVDSAEASATSQLILEGVGIEDGGRYSCCFGTSCVMEACLASQDILVGWPPENAADLRCTSNNFQNANCTWTRGGQHSNLPTKDVLQRKGFSGEWELCSKKSEAICTSTTCHLYCSKDGMDHSYRVESSNALATVHSNEIIFDLDSDTILNPPADVTVTNKSSSSLVVHWSLPPELSNTPVINLIGFCLQYKLQGSNQTYTKAKPKCWIPKDHNVVFDYTINNLTHPYGLYQVKVGACVRYTDNKKCWNFSKKVLGRTTEVAPINSPRGFTCDPVNREMRDSQTVNLTWKAVPNLYKQNGEILGYLIVIRNQYLRHPVANVTVNSSVTSVPFEGLHSHQPYNISIQTRNSMGLSDPNWCFVPGISPGVYLVPVFVSGSILCVILVALGMVWFWKKCKSCVRKWPAARLPDEQLMNNNFALARASTLVREREVFDKLPFQEQVPSDNGQDGGLTGLGVPRGACGGRSHPGSLEWQDLGQTNAGCDTDSLNTVSPGCPLHPSRRVRYTSSEASSPHSPLSVASGGSYMILKDLNQVVHNHNHEGLSPVDRDQQRMRSDRSPGLVVQKIDTVSGSTSRFVWDERIIGGRSLGLGNFTENDDHPLGSPSSLNSPHKCSHCQSIIEGKGDVPSGSETCALLTGENRYPGRGLLLVPVAEEKDETKETQEGRENPDVSGGKWESLTTVPINDAARLKKEPQMDSKIGELNFAACYCKMDQVGSKKGSKDEKVEKASDYCKMKSQVGLDESVCTQEGIDGSVGSQWPWNACHADGFLSDQEPLLSPDSTGSLQGSGLVIAYESLNYVSVCTDESDEEMEEQKASSRISTTRPFNDSNGFAIPKDSSLADLLAKSNNSPHHPAATREKKETLRVSQTGEFASSEGYCRMDLVASKKTATEGESTPASDYCDMKPVGLNKFIETSGSSKGCDWSQWSGDTDDGEVFLSEQETLLSPGSSISSPLCEGDGLLRGNSLVQDYERLNYISVCVDGSDEEEDEQPTSDASQPLHNADTSAVQRDNSQSIINTSLEDCLADSGNRPNGVALCSDEGFEEGQERLTLTT